jgi:hypothetical protein
MTMKLQPVQIATGSKDHESRLVFVDGMLVAVLVQLSGEHDSVAGRWFLEAGFGRVDGLHAPIFADLDEAQAWIAGKLSETAPPG